MMLSRNWAAESLLMLAMGLGKGNEGRGGIGGVGQGEVEGIVRPRIISFK